MSSNIAKKSTGTRASPRSAVRNLSNQLQKAKRSANSQNSPLQPLDSSSSESEAPTQRLRLRRQNSLDNAQNTPGPSNATSFTLPTTDVDEETEAPTQRPNLRGRKVYLREESTSETTSDSDDQAPGYSYVRGENNKASKDKRQLSKAKRTQNKRRRVQRQTSSSATDEDESEPAKSPPTTVKERKDTPKSQPSSLQGRNVISLVRNCVYYLLIADQTKHAIKKQDILKHVFNNQDHKLYGVVIEEVNKVLQKTYGLEILNSGRKKGEYLLINILNRDLGIQEFVEMTPVELQKHGLLFYLITVIFMNEKSIGDEELWEALKPLGIDVNSRTPHPIFGDVKKYITSELVKQMYLEYKCINKDPPQFEFTWGLRAEQEFAKIDLLNFACQIMMDTKPENWILQYNDAVPKNKQSENEQA